jgi:hypothetical protein
MALDLEPDAWLRRLIRLHDAEMSDLRLMDSYYEGTQPLSYLAPEIQSELNDRMRQLIINWPQLVVDALDERLDIEGFRYADSERTESELWRIWQANDLDEGSQQVHVDALALRRSYLIVGANEEDEETPLVTAESALEVFTELDPRTRQTMAGIKRWEEPAADGSAPTSMATLYLPKSRHTFQKDKGQWVEQGDQRDEHDLGVVPVVPLANRPRLKHRGGTSELRAVIPVSDAACKVASDMMVSAEYHAMPRRWATGMSRDDFADENGQPLGALSSLAGRLWVNEDTGVKFGQFPEAQLTNFHDTINQLARLVSALTGLPPSFLGLATDQPPSADAIRASEARLIKRAERRQRAFGEAWERVMRLVLLIRDGEVDPRTRSLETVWRDPATPTYAQVADAVTKLYAAGLLPREMAWEKLGYSATQIVRMAAMEDAALTRMAAADLHAISTAPPEPAPALPGSTAAVDG